MSPARLRPILHRLGLRLWTYGRPGPFLVVEFPNGAEQANVGTVAGLIAGLAEWFNGVCPGVRVDADVGPTATFGCRGTHVLVCVREPAQPEAEPTSATPKAEQGYSREEIDLIAWAGETARWIYLDGDDDEGGAA